MPKKKASDWSKHSELLRAGISGWNPLMRLPKVMQKEFPDLQEFDFGFFSDEDVPERRSMGWDFLDKEDFDVEEFNKTVGLRFGLTLDAAGHVKWRENYIMVQPKWYREEYVQQRERENTAVFERAMTPAGQFAPGDPRADEMQEASEELSSIQTKTVQAKEPPQRPRGRPPTK